MSCKYVQVRKSVVLQKITFLVIFWSMCLPKESYMWSCSVFQYTVLCIFVHPVHLALWTRFLGQEPDINQSQCIVWGSTWNDIRWHISKAMYAYHVPRCDTTFCSFVYFFIIDKIVLTNVFHRFFVVWVFTFNPHVIPHEPGWFQLDRSWFCIHRCSFSWWCLGSQDPPGSTRMTSHVLGKTWKSLRNLNKLPLLLGVGGG